MEVFCGLLCGVIIGWCARHDYARRLQLEQRAAEWLALEDVFDETHD